MGAGARLSLRREDLHCRGWTRPLEVLQWAREQEPPCRVELVDFTCYNAVEGDHKETLKRTMEHSYPLEYNGGETHWEDVKDEHGRGRRSGGGGGGARCRWKM